MKATIKFLSLLFVIVMVVSACAPAAAPSTPASAAPTAAPAAKPTEAAPAAAAGKYPAKPVKICVETFDPADTQYKGVQDYLNFLAKDIFNVEYVFSEKIDSAEQELQFIENCAAAGGKGLIAYYNVSKGQAIAKAAELKVYYWGIAEEKEVYDQYKNNPYYLGSVILGNGDYDGMYAVTKALLGQGKTKLIYANGGADFGVTMFVNRKQGFLAAVDEAKKAGKDIQVSEVPGFPDEAWFAAQGAALAKDVDGVVGSFGAEVWAQPIAAANKADKIKVASFGAITDFYKQMFSTGLVTAIAAEPTERFGIAVAQIINAVDGNAAALQDNQAATNAPQKLWVVTSPDDFTKVAAYEAGDGRAQFSKQLVKLVKNLNPDASLTTLTDLIKAYSLEAIVAK